MQQQDWPKCNPPMSAPSKERMIECKKTNWQLCSVVFDYHLPCIWPKVASRGGGCKQNQLPLNGGGCPNSSQNKYSINKVEKKGNMKLSMKRDIRRSLCRAAEAVSSSRPSCLYLYPGCRTDTVPERGYVLTGASSKN